jgi:hypothetical protein
MLAKRRLWDKSAPLSEFPTRNDFMRAVLFMIQASASNTPKGKRHHEKSVGLGNTGCWSRGGLHDVSSWRVTGCDCSAYGDQPCGIVGDGIENSFQLRHSLLRGGFAGQHLHPLKVHSLFLGKIDVERTAHQLVGATGVTHFQTQPMLARGYGDGCCRVRRFHRQGRIGVLTVE